jgi:Cdc6-like AAA superfamily ATPase
METMQSWYGLKEAHKDFTIENDTDARLLFARHDLDEELKSMLRRSFRTETPPKLVLYGEWGVGKTHTMRHIEYVIAANDDFRATVVFVELPDIVAKSSYQVAHAAFLDALGLEKAREWVVKYQTNHSTDAREQIQEFTQSGDVAAAFDNLITRGDGSRIAWDWLRGISLSATEARLVGLPSTLAQSTSLVRVLQMFGRLSLEADEKLLVFMLDEATKLQYVSNNDAVNHWINAFKALSDPLTKEVGFVVSGSWIDPDEMALPLQDQQVFTRFGEKNYIRLHNLNEGETRVFIKALLSEWVDPGKREEISGRYSAEAEGESVTGETFPFTEGGLDVAVLYACRNAGVTTPRDIQKALDDLFNRAIDEGRHILPSSYVNSLVSG